MSCSRTLRDICRKSTVPARPSIRRKFHCSRSLAARRKPTYPSLKAPEVRANPTFDPGQPYTKAEKDALSRRYTPAQIEAIEAGESAVDTEDLANQATLRQDSFALQYIDDLSKIHPVIDMPIRAPESNYDPNLRFKEEDELFDGYVDTIMNMPENSDQLDDNAVEEMFDKFRVTVGKEEAELNPRSYLAPEIPVIDSLKPPEPPKDEEDPDALKRDADVEEHIQRLIRQTGFTRQQIRRFRVKNLVQHRVVNQTRMGKIQSLYYLSVAGNGKGLLGIGEGKATEPEAAKRQATFSAIRNMQPIPRYEERTIFGDVSGKVGATELVIMNRPPGMR